MLRGVSASSSHDHNPHALHGHDLYNKVLSLSSADGPPVVGHYDISDTDSNRESMSVETVRATVIKRELKAHRGQDKAAHSGCIKARGFLAGQLPTWCIQLKTHWRRCCLDAVGSAPPAWRPVWAFSVFQAHILVAFDIQGFCLLVFIFFSYLYPTNSWVCPLTQTPQMLLVENVNIQ